MNVLYTWENNSSFYNDIWGYVDSDGNEYAIVGTRSHYNFINVTSNANATLVDSYPGSMNSTWRDMKTYSQWAYGCTEANEGLSIFFMGDNPSQNGVSFVTQNRNYFTSAHNIFIDEEHGRLYALGTNTQGGGIIILDIKTNPEAPVLLASESLQGGYIHDMYVKDNIGYANSGGRGLYIYDFTDPDNIQVLGTLTSYPEQGYNHACWLNEDGQHLIMADETRNTGLKVVDVSDPSDIEVESTFRSALLGPADTRSIAHNPFIRDDYVIISYYHDGIQVFDMSNPNNVQQVAWYDTEPDNTSYSGFDGAWGAYPYLPSGKIIGTDVQTGLYVLRATDITFDPIPPVAPPTASLNHSNSVCIEEGSSITLTVDTDADVIQWFRGFTQVGFSKDLVVNSEGDYTVKVYKGPHSLTLTVNVGFGELPDASLNQSGPISLCEGDTHTISVNDAQNNSYTWLVNGFIDQDETSNVYVADNIGVYQVIVSNGSCSAFSEEFLITNLTNAPDLSLNFTETQQLCSGELVTLEVPEGADSYQWYLNGEPVDGATLNDFSTTEEGDYYVEGSLGNCTIESETVTVEVNTIPTSNLNFVGDQSVCEGSSVVLNVESGADNYDWFLNDELVLSGNSNELIAEQNGDYTVVVSNQDCESESEIFSLTVEPNPTVEIEQEVSNEICEGENFTFTASGQADNYVWLFNTDVVPGENGNTITVNQAGTYEVVASLGNCDANSEIVSLDVLEIPQLTYGGLFEYQICEGDEIVLDMTASIGEIQWFKDGIALGLNENPITVDEAGTYQFVSTNEICSNSSEIITVSIQEDINVNLDVASNDIEICEGENFVLTSLTNGTTYNWFRDGVLLDENSGTLNIDASGEYTLEIINGNCSGISQVVNVSYSENPQVDLISLNGLSFCEDEDFALEATAGFDNYDWYRDGQLITNTGSELETNIPGTYQVVIANGQCVGESNTISISQEELFIAIDHDAEITFCAGDELLLEATSGYISYEWFMNGQAIGQNENTLFIDMPGDYQVFITNGNCDASSSILTITQEQGPTIDLQTEDEVTFCNGQSLLMEPIVDASSYEWYRDGALIAETYSLNIEEAGSYFMIASNGNCSTTSNTIVVKTIDVPSVELNMALGQTICEGEEITLAVPAGAEMYEWVFEGEVIGTSNELVVSTAGFYFIRASNGDCVNQSMDISVTVIESNELNFNFSGQEIICKGESITLAVSAKADQYNWMFNGELIDANSSSLEISEAGIYTLNAMIGDCISTSESFELIVQENPTVEYLETDVPSLCVGESYQITLTGDAQSYVWFRNDDVVPSALSNELEVSQSGTYYAVASNGSCNNRTEDLMIEFNELPVALINGSANAICENSIEDILLSSEAVGDSYEWMLDGEVVGTEQSISTNEPGSYTLTITNQNCESTSEAFEISSVNAIEAPIIATGNSICEGEALTLETSAIADSYVWFFNDEIIQGATSNSVVVSTAGTYTLAVNANNCIGSSDTYELEVIQNPDATLTSDLEINLCDGETSTLGVVEDADSFVWFFNGEMLDDDDTTLEVSEGGAYQVMVTNNGCSTLSEIVDVNVNPNPEAIWNVESQNSICAGGTLLLEISDAESYEWIFNNEPIDNNSSTLEASEAGTYQVMISSNGCSSLSEVIEVDITEVPEAILNVPAQNSICEGEILTLEVTEGDSYAWIFNGQDLDSNSPTIGVSEAGSYQATIFIDGCSSMSEEITLELISAPILSTNDETVLNGCEGELLAIEVMGEAETYSWVLNNQEISNQTILEVTESGTYQAIGYNGTCGSDPISFEVNISDNPDASLNLAGEQAICLGESLVLIANPGFDSYQWFRNDTALMEEGNEIEISEAGTYYVQVSQDGCENESVETILEVIDLPQPIISSDALQICPGELTNLNTDAAGDVTYTWFINGDEIADSNSSSIDTNLPGSYSVEINFNGCSTISLPIEVTEHEVIPPSIDQIEDILSSSLANSYQWYLDGVAIDGATGQGHTALVSGTYYVIVIDENGCESQSEDLEVIVSSSENIGQIEGLKVYPNPVLDILTIEYDAHGGEISNVRVFNELGMNVHRTDLNLTGALKKNLNVNHLAAGIYYLEISLDTGFRSTIKFIKVK